MAFGFIKKVFSFGKKEVEELPEGGGIAETVVEPGQEISPESRVQTEPEKPAEASPVPESATEPQEPTEPAEPSPAPGEPVIPQPEVPEPFPERTDETPELQSEIPEPASPFATERTWAANSRAVMSRHEPSSCRRKLTVSPNRSALTHTTSDMFSSSATAAIVAGAVYSRT